MFSFKKKEKLNAPLNVPKHIAVIMDGNLAKGDDCRQGNGCSGLDCLCLFNGKLVSAGKGSFLYHEFAG